MKTKNIVYIILAVLFFSLVAYRIVANKSAKEAGMGGAGGGGGRGAAAAGKGGPGGPGGGGMPPARVDGIIVKTTSFDNDLTVSGSIEANEQVQVRSEVAGLVRSISFKEGSNVGRGQVLVKIDDRELQAQLAQALTRQNLAAQTENRARQLLAKEAISQEEYDVALAELRQLRSQTQLIRAQISRTVVRAPFSGRIGLRSISAGEYVTPSTTIANLVNINPIKISFTVPEKYSGQIKNGSPISFSVAGSTRKYSGNVYAIEPGIQASTRTLQLRAKAPNPEGTLLPGSFVSVDLQLSTINDAILVPTQAVIPVQKGKKVFVADNGKAKEVMVETSTRTASDILVISGLKAGDTVLTTGMMSLKPEAPVKVKVVNN